MSALRGGQWLRMMERTHRSHGPRGVRISQRTSVRQRIGPKLDVHGARHRALAAFLEPGRAVAVRAPQPSAFPPGVGIVDTPVKTLGVEAERIRNPDRDHLAVL